uniref:Ubiquitin carboxyl-terminal hydrolase n=1 Tax=Aegilops tauschii TaxID=37682 RepID=M8BXL8_AEGTA
MGKFEHGNLLLSLSQGHWHGYSLTAVAVALGIGVAGLCRALNSSLGVQWLLRRFSSESERLYYTGGLQNLGNNCFLNVILQALASCDHFVSSLDDLLGSDDVLPEEQSERMPLILALSSLLKDLSRVRDQKIVLNPESDASEAFVHLLTSLRDEFSHCYVPYKSSLADITMFHSKVYKQREDRMRVGELTPLSLDFENFHCLPLSPVADINGDIINGCSLVDCLKHFTVLEHLDNYRCDHCWHNAASKYFSLQSEVDEEKVNKLRTCVDYDSCNCKHLFGPEKTTWSVSSKATKQLAITRCPKILCIHLLRASISFDGELVKRQGHVSFPLLLNLSPFAGGTFTTGQGPGPSAMNVQRYDTPSLQFYRQLNAHMPINMLTTGGNSSSQAPKDQGNVDVATSSSPSSSSSSRMELYRLSAVVEHYGVCGGGHYAAYRRVASTPDANDQVGPRRKHWVYVSDDHVSQVSEDDVLGAEATLLFYERL